MQMQTCSHRRRVRLLTIFCFFFGRGADSEDLVESLRDRLAVDL